MATNGGKLLHTKQGDIEVVSFVNMGFLDEANIRELGAQLLGLAEQTPAPKIILNFTNVEYLSSAVLGKLVALHKKVLQGKGELKLCCIKSSILQVFKVTKLDKLFAIHATQVEAEKAFKGAAAKSAGGGRKFRLFGRRRKKR